MYRFYILERIFTWVLVSYFERVISFCVQYLDENKQLILAILDNQNLGKLNECATYASNLPHFFCCKALLQTYIHALEMTGYVKTDTLVLLAEVCLSAV